MSVWKLRLTLVECLTTLLCQARVAPAAETILSHSFMMFAYDTQLHRHCHQDEVSATWTMPCWSQPLDISEPSWAEFWEDAATLGGFKAQSIVVRMGWFVSADWFRHHTMIMYSVWPSRPTWAWTNMFPTFVQHVSTGSANFDEFDGHLMASPRRRSFTPSSQPDWTTATWYSLVHRVIEVCCWQTAAGAECRGTPR